jgi:hypothetical protein
MSVVNSMIEQKMSVQKKSGDSLARVCTWFLGAMSLLTVCTTTALGQESQPDPPAMSEPKSVTQKKVDNPAKESTTSTKKRRILSKVGPQQLTPEQQEEAERIRQLNAKFGTDPTAITGRVQLSSQFRNLSENAGSILTVVRVDLPFKKDYVLSVQAPFLQSSVPGRTGTTNSHGFSDLGVLLGWRAYNTPEYAFFIGMNAVFPTATENKVGLGKYSLGPIIATSRFLPKWESFLFGVLSHKVSVGGDSARKSINVSSLSLRISTIWAEKWWSVAQAGWRLDWERSTRGSMNLELEVGRNIVGKWGVFIRPGIGIFGQDLPGAYNWNIKGGIRYVFAGF